MPGEARCRQRQRVTEVVKLPTPQRRRSSSLAIRDIVRHQCHQERTEIKQAERDADRGLRVSAELPDYGDLDGG